MKDYGVSFVISLVLKLKGDGKMEGDGLWLCPSVACMQANRVVHEEKWMSVGNDGMG